MRILMVCMGNICRSPMAEGIMRQLAKENNLDWEIASAGTGNWHVGKAPDDRSIAIAQTYGYDISGQRARHFTSNLFNEFDHIFVMDKNNYKDVLKHAKNNEHREKVSYFLADYGEVIDPYLHDHLFDPVIREIEARCKKLIKELGVERRA
jgi:protein-tyrosine phosphatase